jgi:hypothetical protein
MHGQLPTLSDCAIHFKLTEVRLRSFLASPHFLQIVPAPPPLHFCLARAKLPLMKKVQIVRN